MQLAAELLAAPVAVGVRRVEERDALLDGGLKRRARVVGGDRPPIGTELPGAQTDNADAAAEPLDSALLHLRPILADRHGSLYREAFRVLEMERGPYCSAIYEIAEIERHPVDQALNFSKPPIEFGLIHYASDTLHACAHARRARPQLLRMDSTYASSPAILRRVLKREGIQQPLTSP